MNVGLNVGFAKNWIKILLRVAGVTIIALDGKPRIQMITVANEKAAALGCVMRDINIGEFLGRFAVP
jgi:hypothetical protein